MILIIAEKPSVARKIAYALGGKTVKREQYKKVSYYSILIDGQRALVVPAVGHLYSLREREPSFSYPVFDIDWVPVFEAQKGKSYAKPYLENFERLKNKVMDVVVATDYDTEGEVIGYNIVRFALGKSPALVKRMKFSALTRQDLLEAWRTKTVSMDLGLAYAGMLRHYLDWYWGINFSRALMRAVRSVGGGRVSLSIGRVQGPTLKLVVDREREIRAFKPQTYYVVKFTSHTTPRFVAELVHDRIFDESLAKRIVQEVNSRGVKVKEIKKSVVKKHPLPPFDLGTLQKEAFSIWGYSPARTLDIAQKLYESGYLTYPRTESQKLPRNRNHRAIIEKLARLPFAKDYARALSTKETLRPVEGSKDDPAHPAIAPTGELPNLNELDEKERNIYELVVRRYLACFGDDAVIERTKLVLESGGYVFEATGQRIIERGWLEIYPYVKIEETELPPLVEGRGVEGVASYYATKTKPPSRYSPSSLLAEMERLGLGTKATRGQIIETLYRRGYIEGRKVIRPTRLGEAVIEVLERYVPQVIDVKLTREFEEMMELVQNKKLEFESALYRGEEEVRKLAEEFKQHEEEIGKALLEVLGVGKEKSSKKRHSSPKRSSRRRSKFKGKRRPRGVGASSS